MDVAKICMRCRFYDELNRQGYCCRYTPVVIDRAEYEHPQTHYPIVQPREWCGEWVFDGKRDED